MNKLPKKAKEIPNFSGYYITKTGKVWSTKRQGGFLKPLLNNSGHLRVELRKNNKRYMYFIHRLVLETFVGPCPKGMECCHNNGIPIDNFLENLRWDTHSNNQKDAIKHGTHNFCKSGQQHYKARLNDLQVRVIRRLLEFNTLTQTEISGIFNVSQSTISDIKRGRIWTTV